MKENSMQNHCGNSLFMYIREFKCDGLIYKTTGGTSGSLKIMNVVKCIASVCK